MYVQKSRVVKVWNCQRRSEQQGIRQEKKKAGRGERGNQDFMKGSHGNLEELSDPCCWSRGGVCTAPW